MKAVNLVPVERRAAAAGAGAGVDPLQLALLGVLAVLLLSAGAWAYLRHDAGAARTEAAETTQRSAAAEQQAAALAPAVALQSKRRDRQQKVAQLAAGRIDWSLVFTRLAGSTPSGVRLTNVEATSTGATDGAAATSAPASGTAATGGPSLALTACASSQRLVARTLDRYRAAEGVADVTLTSSTRAGSGDGGSDGCSGVSMIATVSLTGSAGGSASTAATGTAAGATSAAPDAAAPTTTSIEPAPIPGADQGSEGATQ